MKTPFETPAITAPFTVTPAPRPAAPDAFIHPRTGCAMALIPGGEFAMGSAEGSEAEGPVHPVRLRPFRIDVHPVTNAAFARFADATGHVTAAERDGKAWGCREGRFEDIAGLNWRTYGGPGREDHPVVLVDWHDADAYARWAGLRLPTEAEWERCARGDQEGVPFPWGTQEPDGSQSNFARTAADLPPTNPVGCHEVNAFGVADLVGNVWQWCADWFATDYYQASPVEEPVGPAEGQLKVRRGGSWNVIQGFRLRCSNRGAAKPQTVAPNMGFRCASDF